LVTSVSASVFSESQPKMSATNQAMWIAVAHDLRTPLAALSIAVETALDGVGRPQRSARRLIDVIRRNLSLMLELVEEAEFPTPDVSLGTRSLNVEDLSHELATLFEPLLRVREQSLTVDVTSGPFMVRADRASVLRVLVNLIDNASKYGPPGDRIRVALKRRPGAVLIQVCDHGPGIPLDERELVFRPFYRGRTAPAVEGTGLGLTTVRGVVLAHGGRVHINRRRGETRVCVLLPEARPQAWQIQ
jgi:signal transduction histidine kinase